MIRRIFIVLAAMALIPAASANMPGTLQPLLVSGAKVSCTGGSVSTSGGNTIHSFSSSSSLVCVGTGDATYLIVAGGGGGSWGGGGAGGMHRRDGVRDGSVDGQVLRSAPPGASCGDV